MRVQPEKSRIFNIFVDTDKADVDPENLDTPKMNFLLKTDFAKLNALDKELHEWLTQIAQNSTVQIKNTTDILGNKKFNDKDPVAKAAYRKALEDKYGPFPQVQYIYIDGALDYVEINFPGKVDALINEADEYLEPDRKHKKYQAIMAYQEILKEAYAYRGEIKEGNLTYYEAKLAELRRKAAKTSARIKLIEEFGKRMHITFNPCKFEDPFKTTKDSETTKTTEKKDSVPNTAAFNFFPQLPTTCAYAIVSEGEGCCKVFKVVKACELAKGAKTVTFTYNELAEYSIKALACSCK